MKRPAWQALSPEAALGRLDAREDGLRGTEATARLRANGPNQLPRQPALPWWRILVDQFRNPLIYVLGAAALVSLAIGDASDAGFIAAVLAINASIGGYQEWRAEQSSRALQQLLKIRATVLRDGEAQEIDAEGLVPGDVVWLEPGNYVPADLRLLSGSGLEVDESLLTGESLAVLKDAAWLGEVATPLADRRNLAHAGTLVVRGRARGLVVATGSATAVGELALAVLGATGGKPPLLLRMERFSRAVALVVLAAALVIGAVGVLGRGYPLSMMFLFVVALAVSAIPEGLPVALTVALAVAARRMARRGVIVRRLAAVEGLGSCTLIASDKTGTLTCNELTVREIHDRQGRAYQVTGQGFDPAGQVLVSGAPVDEAAGERLRALARAAVLCNEADLHPREGGWISRGDPTDVALLVMAHKLGCSRELLLVHHPERGAIPFEPERQYAASFNEVDGHVRVFVKGAPERVLASCRWPAQPDQPDQRSRQAAADAAVLAARGYRVLALAEGAVAGDLAPGQLPPEPTDLSFLGLVGMIDPLRAGAREAVAACREAGIRVCMVTGDHPVTALAIARELGLAETADQVVSGRKLEGRTAGELQEIVDRVRVFARVAPTQKLLLVEAARRAGHFVAVTGDGVNDAPALRAANIGVAMGRSGTDVAREAAELVLSDDNFATIVAGVEEGRVAYENVRNVIYLLISTGAAELMMIGLAVAAGLPLPLLPVQLLWLNLVTNGIQDVALAFEPGEPGVLARPPRPPGERIFNRLMIERTVLAALVMGLLAFASFSWMLRSGWSEASARNGVLLLMVLFESIHIGNCRSETTSGLRLSPLRSPLLLFAAALAVLIHVVAMYLPLGQRLLRTEALDGAAWAGLLAVSLSIFVVMELHKWARGRWRPET